MAAPIRLLDVGCGTGRNLRPFLRREFRVFAVDLDLDAMVSARYVLPEIPAGSAPLFSVAHVRNMPFPDGVFGSVLCMDLLHWAQDAPEFESWWREIWRTLRPGGVLCARFRIRGETDSSASLEKAGRHWFLMDPAAVFRLVEKSCGEWVEPWVESPIKGGGRQGNALVMRVR